MTFQYPQQKLLIQESQAPSQVTIEIRAGPRDVVAGGGGTGSRSLEPSGENREGVGGEYERGVHPPLIRGAGASPGKFCKIYVSENAFQAILKPIFPYFITSILVR